MGAVQEQMGPCPRGAPTLGGRADSHTHVIHAERAEALGTNRKCLGLIFWMREVGVCAQGFQTLGDLA